MNTRTIKAGTVDVSVVIRIVDSTDGTPETGVVFNTAGIDLQYRRELEASTAITEATLAALTTAHADGGFLHIGNGYYRLDLPDAACATGATGVLVHGIVTGMVVIGCYVELVSYDPQSATNLGLSQIDAATSSRMATYTQPTGFLAAAFPTDPADQSLIIAATDAVMTRLGAPAGASVSADIAAVKVDTAATLVDTAEIGAAGAGLTALGDTRIANLDATISSRATPVQVNAEMVDVLATDTYTEPAQGTPAATTTLAAKINYIYKFLRNKITTTSTTISIYDDAGTTVDQKSTISDDATTFTRGEFGTGP